MKLFLNETPDQVINFGDALNRWLWPQICPELFSASVGKSDGDNNSNAVSSTVFVGTGTVLNSSIIRQLSPTQKVVVFGTGVDNAQPLQAIPLSWDIRALRGPLSARRLGLPASKSITDAGALVAQVFEASCQRSGCSFMPHIDHAAEAADSWQRICERAGIRYIDPRWPVEKVLRAIASSERLLTESLYGAIVSDALRIHWIPVVTSPRIPTFKWQDWCLSLDLFYHPYHLPALSHYAYYTKGLSSVRHWLKAVLEGPVAAHQYALLSDESAIAGRLGNIAKQAPTLSQEDIFQQKLTELQACFQQFVRQYTREPIMHADQS